MPSPIITKLPGSLVEMKFVVTPEEAQPYLDQASIDLQASKPIPGFRPGKAPYDEVKKTFGEMKLWETALERIVRAKYVHAILEDKVDTIGSPAISIDQLVPGQNLKFTVTAPVMPIVLNLISYDQPLIERKTKEVKDTEVDSAIEDLRKMRRQEAVVDRPATKEDMAVVDLEITKDKVIVEGGTSKNYRIYLSEPHYIPGFADQLVGLKKGDTKSFELAFPKDHYQKHLSGQKVTFAVVVNDVFELKVPELNDEFAKSVGLDSLQKLRLVLLENLTKEAEQKSDESSEIQLLEKLVDGSKFSEVPELLVNEEVRRMFSELEHAAEHQGMKMEDYLSQLKKSVDQIKLDMVPQAIRRVQTAVLIKEVSKKENVIVTEDEIDAELDRILSKVEDKETRDRVSSPEYRDYLMAQMKNRKTLEILKKKGIK